MKICDVKTWANKDDVKVGDEGYFSNDICFLEKIIERDFKRKIKHIDPFRGNCFVAEIDENEPSRCSAYSGYSFFMPADKVRKSMYRPIKTFEELFNFFVPNFEEEYFGLGDGEYDTYKKTELLLGLTIALKRKADNFIEVSFIQNILFLDKDLCLNGRLLKDLFKDYEIQMNGKWVPFGIKD